MITIYKVLLVDDSAFMRAWISRLLHDSDRYIVIEEAKNGKEALEKYHLFRPDLVIMDVVMDDMNGIEALSLLLKLFPSAQVVMCSSLGQSSLVTECLQIGAKDFIMKPFFNQLVQKLDLVMTSTSY